MSGALAFYGGGGEGGGEGGGAGARHVKPVPSPGLTLSAIASKTFPFWDMLNVESVPRMPRRCMRAARVIAASFGGRFEGTGKASPEVVLYERYP